MAGSGPLWPNPTADVLGRSEAIARRVGPQHQSWAAKRLSNSSLWRRCGLPGPLWRAVARCGFQPQRAITVGSGPHRPYRPPTRRSFAWLQRRRRVRSLAAHGRRRAALLGLQKGSQTAAMFIAALAGAARGSLLPVALVAGVRGSLLVGPVAALFPTSRRHSARFQLIAGCCRRRCSDLLCAA